jgi:hypothetical protein
MAIMLALGGSVIGSVLGGARLRPVAEQVVVLLVVAAGLVVVLQSVGDATAPVAIP